MTQTVEDIRNRLRSASPEEFTVLERTLKADTRKGVKSALETARKRVAAQVAEDRRLASLYSYQEELSGHRLLMGLDEVGRGPLAGPLSVGAVVLPPEPHIAALNDSKKIPEARRAPIAEQIKAVALAWHVEHIPPEAIDALGMSICLKQAFSRSIAAIDAQLEGVEVVLIDGNPLHIDDREINVIKGDGKCAAIAAASIVAKVDRDAMMVEYDTVYPGYDFAQSKGYASPNHIEAIKTHGLTDIHRRSFCTSFTQQTLF